MKVAGENYYIGLSTYRLVAFAVGGRELGYCKHLARLLAGGGVDIEILEEDLRISSAYGTILGLVLRLDVDGC